MKSTKALARARQAIEGAASQPRASARARADIGLLRLISGQPVLAVKALESARSKDPADASIWSDLAAAYLARFGQSGQFLDLLFALEAADSAVKLDPTLPEARFNFALILDRLSLRYRARAEWTHFLELTDGPGWRREAEEGLAAQFQPGHSELWTERRAVFEEARDPAVLARELVNLSPQQARELGEEELLGRWAAAHSKGRFKDAARALLLARSLGSALAAINGDRMVAEAVQSIDAAFSGSSVSIFGGLIKGHARFQDGLELYSKGSFEAATHPFSVAIEELAAAGSPFELWARFRLALCEYQRFRYDAVQRDLEDILEDPRSQRFPALRARAFWVLGLTQGIRDAPAESLAAYRQSREILSQLGERGNSAAVSNLIAEAHQNLGDFAGAWKLHGMAVESLPWVANSLRKQLILEKLADSLVAAGKPELSIYFREESLRRYSGDRVPAALVPGLLRIAESHYRQGNTGKALAFLHHAESEISSVSEKPLRQALLGDLLAWEGKAEAETDPGDAVRLLTAAIYSYENSEYRQQLTHMRLQRARALRHQRRYGAAEEDLRRAIEMIDTYRSSGDISTSSFGVVRQVFNEMVLLQVLQNRPGAAFEYAEKGRSKLLSLLAASQMKETALANITLAQIQEELPPETAMMVFWVGESDLFLWAVRRDGFAFRSMRLDVKRLDQTVIKFQKAVSTDDRASADRLGEQLYGALLQPLEKEIADAGTLVLVPDQVLQAVPFATLRNASGYVIEAHALSVSPSASLYVRCLRRQRDLASVEPTVLAFGDPAFDHSLFPDLQRLSHSAEEARQIVELYSAGKLVLGDRATKARLLSEIGSWQVIHFGGHAVSNPENPFLSALLLAPETNGSGVFYVRSLAGARLKNARLMFLAACSTLLGGPSEAGLSIAAPLLAQGVPSVVGTLWAVSDRQSERFAVEFHRRFLDRRNAARALREAQVAFLDSSRVDDRKTSLWGAFEALGAQ